MAEELRAEINMYLSYLRNHYPELRVGQIIVNAASKGGWSQNDIFYCPDNVLLNGLKLLCDEVIN